MKYTRQVHAFGGWSLDTDPNFSRIGTFAVPLLMYVLTETHIKGILRTLSDKDAVIWIGYILKGIIVEEILVPQNAPKLGGE